MTDEKGSKDGDEKERDDVVSATNPSGEAFGLYLFEGNGPRLALGVTDRFRTVWTYLSSSLQP